MLGLPWLIYRVYFDKIEKDHLSSQSFCFSVEFVSSTQIFLESLKFP